MNQPKPTRVGPSVPVILVRGLRKRCPACGQGKLFHRWFSIAEQCPRCGLKFERIEGHWIGSVGMNTIITFGLVLIALIVSLLLFINSDIPQWYVAIGLGILALTIPPLIDPFTRTFWTAIDIAMRPLEATEVDWTVVDPDAVGVNSAAGPMNSADGNTPGP